MPLKSCPDCSTKLGARTHKCACGHIFKSAIQKKTLKKKPKKNKSVKKIPKRTYKKNKFKPPPQEPVDWKTLIPGDIIKVVSGTGPYVIVNEGKYEEFGKNIGQPLEEVIYVGYSGIFKVAHIGEYGIHAYPVKANESGHCFIYCGEKDISPVGICLEAHKILMVKKKTNDIIT